MSVDTSSQPILIVRVSAIGDIIMASGLPAALKQADPKSPIYWLVESPYTELVENHPHVAGVIAWPKQEWKKLFKSLRWIALYKAIIAFRKSMHIYHFSTAIDAQGLLKSALLAKLSGAKTRIGFAGKEGGKWLLHRIIPKQLTKHISSEYIGLAQALGASNYSMLIEPSDDDKAASYQLRKQHQIYAPYIICCPFTTRPQKHWPEKYWQTLLQALTQQGYIPVIVGGTGDKIAANQLKESVAGTRSLAGRCTLGQSVAMIQGAEGVIGVDTGMTHLGTTFQKPTVAIFGSTRPYTQTDTPATQVLYSELTCAPCKRKPSCENRFDCMQNITPQMVIERFLSIKRQALE